MAERIVIAEDDEDLAFVLREALIRQQYEVEIAPTAGALLDRLRAGAYDLVLLDVKLPDMDGLDALPRCRELAPETPIIVMTAHGTRQIAMEAITRGAYDLFTKPLKMAEFQVVVARALDRRRLQQQVKVLRAGQPTGFEEIIGQCEPLKRVLDMAQRAAPTDLTILIQGESGTGKEVLAQAIHRLSLRKDGPLIPVNAAAIPEGLLESELFGHERGAFTGALAARRGLFETAAGGTCLLDEIGELSPALQAKLLRALQEQSIRRVGGNEQIAVNVRMIAATNRDLRKRVEEGAFREDLYYRLNVVSIAVPPLRERGADVHLLAQHFVEQYARTAKKAIRGLARETLDLLSAHQWPGNVRELENAIARAVALSSSELLMPDGMSLPPRADPVPLALPAPQMRLDEVRRWYVGKVLEEMGGNKVHAAERLGIDRGTLHRMLRRWAMGGDVEE